jgi:Na+-transporting NADH:ubiquinone oxidoreductase subunit C
VSLDLRWLVPAAIYAVAQPCIAAKYMSVEEAMKLAFPAAEAFVEKVVQLSPAQMQAIDQASGVHGRSAKQQVWAVMVKGSVAGWFLIDQVIGKHELITYTLGINADGSVRQVQIIEYLETYGSQVRYPAWRDQFVGKTVDSPLELERDIGNITGATLSSRHLTEGIKRLLFLHQAVLR